MLLLLFFQFLGELGALFGSLIFKLLHVKYEASKGFALGESATAFAAVAMGLCGIFTAILLPIVIALIS